MKASATFRHRSRNLLPRSNARDLRRRSFRLSTRVAPDGGNSPTAQEGPADAFHLYLREIGPLPLLTPAEEIDLARRARRGDEAAREALIQGNLRLVVRIARDYEQMGMPLLDLIAEGNIGLMKAVDRFDPTRGAKLSVYAGFWIKQCIRRALGNKSRTIRLPIHLHSQLVGLERISRRLHETLGRAPTDKELALESGLRQSQLARLRRAPTQPLSLDAPLDAVPGMSLAETLADEQAAVPGEHLTGNTLRQLLREGLTGLSSREMQVLRLRYGLDDAAEHTLEEVGKEVKVTRERIRQIQNEAIKKLRRWMSKREAVHIAA